MKRPRLMAALLVALAGSGMSPAHAGGLTVSPPHVRFEPGQQTAEVRLINGGDKPVTMQAFARRWTQDASGAEQDSEAADFALYPKVFTVVPGATQIVRVGRLAAAPLQPQAEVAYRLTLRELPVEGPAGGGVSITTRLLLPVWLSPANARADWGFGAPATVQNRGNVHVRLVDVVYSAVDGKGTKLREAKVPGWYVLAGVSRPFTPKIKPEFCAGAARIVAVARDASGSRSAEWPGASFCNQKL